MPAAHVFNVPQPYRAKDELAEPARERRSKFRWFGHAVRLGGGSSGSTAAATTTTTKTKHAAPTSRRSKSSYLSSEDEYSPAPSPRFASKSLTSEADLGGHNHSTSLLKFGLLRKHHHETDQSSLRSSIASTASTSTTLSDDLSPPLSTASFASSTATPISLPGGDVDDNDELQSPRMESETRALLRDVVGVDARWADDAHVARHFAKLRWRVERIEADGNCLFRAVSDQLYRNEAFYGDIRRRVVGYIEREKALFQPFVENERSGLFEPIDAYCARMQQDAQWGGNPELFAVARLFNVHIVVHQGPMRRLRIESGRAEAPAMEMHLLFRKDHYDSLHDETLLDCKPRLSTTVDAAVVVDEDRPSQQDDEPKAQQQDKKMKKKKKCVVFIGEQARVERVEVEPPQVVVHAPVRLLVRRGKVCTLDGSTDEGTSEWAEADKGSNQESATEQMHTSQESDGSAAREPQSAPSHPSSSNYNTNQEDGELHVARVQRVNFRKGRRVAA